MRTRLGLIIAAAIAGVLGLTAGANPAGADAGKPPPSPAILSPLLTTFGLGAAVGMPEACGVVVGALASGLATYPQLAQQFGPYLSQVSSTCAQMAAQGTTYINAFNGAVAPLAAINPVVNPGLETFADELQTLATTYGPSMAPLGPTVAGLGADVRYFEGS
jgi:hypothetical protein